MAGLRCFSVVANLSVRYSMSCCNLPSAVFVLRLYRFTVPSCVYLLLETCKKNKTKKPASIAKGVAAGQSINQFDDDDEQ